jgi:hypothetical protein
LTFIIRKGEGSRLLFFAKECGKGVGRDSFSGEKIRRDGVGTLVSAIWLRRSLIRIFSENLWAETGVRRWLGGKYLKLGV